MNKNIIIGIIVILLIAIGIYSVYSTDTNSIQSTDIDVDTSNLEAIDDNVIKETQSLEKKLFSTTDSDTNAILVENNTTVDVKDSEVNKTGDSTSNGDNTDFYGTNSAILVKKGSTANIENTIITSNSVGSNAIFVTNAESTGENSNEMQSPEGMDMPENGKPADIPEAVEDGQPGAEAEGQPESQPGEAPQDGQMGMDGQNNEDYSNGGATATVTNVKIDTYNDKSRGLDATYGGIINAENVIINTRGGSCAALATDRGEGTVTANSCELNTGVDDGSGRGSPCIYSTGNITVSDSTGTAYKSQIACIEGKNSITLDNCDLNCFAAGNREENGEFVDLGGIFIYQSMSGDADVGTATLNATDCELSIDESSEYYTKAPMFHVTNTKAIINLENCDLSYGSGTLLDISGQNQWGTSGSNGGELEFNINEEECDGNIIVDEISSLVFNMIDSTFNGAINPSDSYGNTSVVVGEGSTWTLTGDSHITSLENNGNIEYGDYTLYVNGEAYTASNPF